MTTQSLDELSLPAMGGFIIGIAATETSPISDLHLRPVGLWWKNEGIIRSTAFHIRLF